MGKYKIVDLVFDEREHEIWVIVINKDEDTGERFLCLLDGSDIMQTTEIYELKPEPKRRVKKMIEVGDKVIVRHRGGRDEGKVWGVHPLEDRYAVEFDSGPGETTFTIVSGSSLEVEEEEDG